MRTTSVHTDAATRDRLLDAGTRLFAEHGFQHVTVRDVCGAAGANVAAINYHFAGKEGLYLEVLRAAVAIMRGTTEEMIRAGEGLSPEAQLESLVLVFLQRVVAGRNGWIHQLMLHEMRKPTAALELIVDEVIAPRFAYVRRVVARLMGTGEDDPRALACATSVQSQLMVVMKSPIAAKLGMPELTVDRVPEVAAHIARFSIGGVRAIAGAPAPATGRRPTARRRRLRSPGARR
jgi:AcrR family transcriptional regulator